MVYPMTPGAPDANKDMPDQIKQDYDEASDIASRSPRSACVLLRLCVEKIADDFVSGGGDLNSKIGKMVKDGLPDKIRTYMDAVRIIGGEAAHHLTMDLQDDRRTANTLFMLVNYISDWAYTQKKLGEEIFETLPEGKKAAIEKRDADA